MTEEVSQHSDVSGECSEMSLTEAQKARIEKNRLKALALRQAKLIPHPYAKRDSNTVTADGTIIKVRGTKFKDSGGGFLIEEHTDEPNPDDDVPLLPTENDTLTIPVKYTECGECSDQFVDSYLMKTFEYAVCDGCRDNDDKHSLITKTEAKSEYLLKDCDLDKREPLLKFITRSNPHNVRWGEMKLYLHVQVEKRALEVWGTEEALLAEREQREKKRDEAKHKKYNKRLKELRMNVRSSLYDKTAKFHVHEFGPETYNETDDNYSHACAVCSFVETYEKM